MADVRWASRLAAWMGLRPRSTGINFLWAGIRLRGSGLRASLEQTNLRQPRLVYLKNSTIQLVFLTETCFSFPTIQPEQYFSLTTIQSE